MKNYKEYEEKVFRCYDCGQQLPVAMKGKHNRDNWARCIYCLGRRIKTYRIRRFYFKDRPSQTIKVGLSLKEAKEHCQDPGATKEGVWFDGFEEE